MDVNLRAIKAGLNYVYLLLILMVVKFGYYSHNVKALRFGKLFRQLRVRTGFKSLSALADALAEKGLVVDESVLSRWQTGKRHPREREVLIGVIEVLAREKRAPEIGEFNKLLESAGHGFLTDSERLALLEVSSRLDMSKLDQITQLQVFRDKEAHTKVVKIWDQTGDYLWRHGEWEKMAELIIDVAKSAILLKDRRYLANLYIDQLCWLYLWQGKLDLAEKFAHKGMSIAHELEDQYLEATAKSRLGKIYQSRLEIGDSLEHLGSALDYFRSKGDEEKVGDITTYIAETLWICGEHSRAQLKFKQADVICSRIGDQAQRGIISTHQAGLYVSTGKLIKAEEVLGRTEQIALTGGNNSGVFWANFGLALIEKMTAKGQTRSDRLSKAIVEKRRLGMKDEIFNTTTFNLGLGQQMRDCDFQTTFLRATESKTG